VNHYSCSRFSGLKSQ